ncbi:hypothetical protein GCM10009678_87330 [Actinomadura kijaniata]
MEPVTAMRTASLSSGVVRLYVRLWFDPGRGRAGKAYLPWHHGTPRTRTPRRGKGHRKRAARTDRPGRSKAPADPRVRVRPPV